LNESLGLLRSLAMDGRTDRQTDKQTDNKARRSSSQPGQDSTGDVRENEASSAGGQGSAWAIG
jgi:hypothetical protein